ncbi:MAG: metallophosphoesterase [Tannerellaceae bacterium]|jgi:manganese-dependent ADP-ribose/CDP-alcohol diphosphatase|nr:metallophosphoesterase [Tannerellaceae bacterium]
MMKRLNLLAFMSALSVYFSLAAYAQSSPESIRFGLIADIQYCDCEPRGSRFYRNSLEKLENCVAEFNREKLEFAVNLGDLVDRDTDKNLGAVLSVLDKFNGKTYNISGNHDYDGVVDNGALYARLGMPASYYSFVVKGWRLVFLNTNEVSLYANAAPLAGEHEDMMRQIRESGRKNGEPYNGGVSKKQLKWLEDELASASSADEKVIVFSHHPIYAAPGLTALNDRDILAVLSASSCVKAVISGHHHPGDFGMYGNIPFITAEGMVETEKENAYGIIEIAANRIVIGGRGRTKSYDLPAL